MFYAIWIFHLVCFKKTANRPYKIQASINYCNYNKIPFFFIYIGEAAVPAESIPEEEELTLVSYKQYRYVCTVLK
jgi:hypothetical protein